MDDLRKAYRVVVIIGLALMATLLIYAAIVGILDRDPSLIRNAPTLPGSQAEIIKFALIAVTVVIFFVIRFVNALLLKANGDAGNLSDARSRQAAGAPPELGRLTTAAVITYALCEAPAIFGLALFLLGRSAADFHLFLLISLFYFAVHFPKFSQWEEWHRKQQGR
jgi:F0F1-type ATP synthase membrane subunit c/vacuolar-type H+-ATPase subunit K